MQINPETQIGPYEIHQLLGQGGMAAVYKVWHTDLQRYEAMKMPLSQNQADEFAERFLKVSRHAAGLHHPPIIAIYNVSSENGEQRYFTMELVEGGDLTDMIYRKGRLSLEDTWTILQQVAGALDYAHACGVWHRDIKPANILLQKTVSGDVFVTLLPYRFVLNGISSPYDLMSSKFGSYGEMNNSWTGEDVKGFTKIFGNQTSIYHQVNKTAVNE